MIQTEQPTYAIRDQINSQMVENVLLVWLDGKINANSSDCQSTIIQLRSVVNTIHTFIDGEECVDFLGDVVDEKVCMIISGSFGQNIVPLVHNMPQVDSIFIFCGNRQYHEQWTKNWSKIKGVFTEIQSICHAVKQAVEQCEQSAISISIMSSDGAVTQHRLDQLDSSFMYTQIMKEILLTIRFEQQHFEQFINYCRKAFNENSCELSHVEELAQTYREHTPIWWYTRDCFLYPVLNRALRVMDVDLIIKLGFFIVDLHRQIEQLYQKQLTTLSFNQTFTVYRGQGMDQASLEKIEASKGGLLSFNSFLSTSRNRQTSLQFAELGLARTSVAGVLFVMTIDPTQSNTPFASVVDVGYFGAREDEVLFSMNTVFRISKISFLDNNSRLVEVQLTLIDDKESDLRQLTDFIRQETFPDSEGWYRLGLVLWTMGESAKAQQLFEILLEEKSEESDKVSIYYRLGLIEYALGNYEKAIVYLEKCIEIEEKCVPHDDHTLAASYNSIGFAYCSMGDYSRALFSYEKALSIQQKLLPTNHSTLAMCYNNIGLVYSKIGDYSRALSFYEKDLKVIQKAFPANHPDLAAPYSNIGNVYFNMDDYPKALSYWEETLAIRQQSLPPNHPELASSYNDIGNAYLRMCDYGKALSSYEKALTIRQQSLPASHPDLASSYLNIGVVYLSMDDYPKALSSYEKSLTIRQQSLPATHPDLALSCNNIGVVYSNMGDYPKALLCYEKALAIQQKGLPPIHPDLAISYSNMGMLYSRMNEYTKAYSCFERAMDVAQHSLPVDHPEIQEYRENLENIKRKL